MSETEQILDGYTRRQGWNESTQLELALRYIEDQENPADFEDFLAGIAETENAEDGSVGWKCGHCGDAITFEVAASPQVWVGSDGEITCPLGDRPHGPPVLDKEDD